MARVYAISDPTQSGDPEYVDSLSSAVSAALDHGVAVMDRKCPDAPPPLLLVQSRLAAQNGIGLDVVLRRYFAGYAVFNDFLMEEANAIGGLGSRAFKRILQSEAVAFDRLVAIVTEEYGRGARNRAYNTGRRQAELIQALLDGELVDTSDIHYEFNYWHLGLVAVGDASETVRELGNEHGADFLAVHRGGDLAWLWLGFRRRPDPPRIEAYFLKRRRKPAVVAMGELAKGLAGWRLTHRQARAALPVAQRSAEGFARYGSVAALSSVLQDDLLATSLHRLYLAPLSNGHDGGEGARETLRAYIAAGQNVSSAAAALAVNRNTVANRLRAIEEKLGRPLTSCLAELDLALRFEELSERTPPPR